MHSPFCEVTFQRLRVDAYAFSSPRRPSARSSAGAHFYGRQRLGRIQGSGMMVGIAWRRDRPSAACLAGGCLQWIHRGTTRADDSPRPGDLRHLFRSTRLGSWGPIKRRVKPAARSGSPQGFFWRTPHDDMTSSRSNPASPGAAVRFLQQDEGSPFTFRSVTPRQVRDLGLAMAG